MSKMKTKKSVFIRALCLAILCFHAHSGFERIFNNSFLLPCPKRATAGLTPVSGADPSEALAAFISGAWTIGNSGLLSRDKGCCSLLSLILCFYG
jgi:hypothetical protein